MERDQLFSSQAPLYAAFRPTYPATLYDFILSQVMHTNAAWDCACGNGQVAKDLSPHFDSIAATDISEKQLENAFPKKNIKYSISPAEKTSFPDQTFDLITVGQGIHWFNIPLFFEEVRRVARPGALLAVWGYSLMQVNEQIDPLITEFYRKVVGPYWDKERKLIDEQYRTIPFPFERVVVPALDFSFSWTLQELHGYLSTWSAVQKYLKHTGRDPVPELIASISPAWKEAKYKISFPLFVLAGRV